jgi:carboxypeptidase PM20D1
VAVGLASAIGLLAKVATAQSTVANREARDLFAELISFRTSAGHGQVPAMATFILKRLADAGVPATDIEQFMQGETTALIVR